MAGPRIDWHKGSVDADTVITPDFRVTPRVRRFIQATVPGFTVSRDFRAWIFGNLGITMADLVAEAQRRDK